MASLAPHIPDATAPPRVRTPKLKYRNSAVDIEVVQPPGTEHSRPNLPASPRSPAQSEFPTSARSTASEIPRPDSSRPPSIALSLLAPPAQTLKLKRKQNFFTGLFTVKEPSAQAFAEYERQLERQGTLKDGRIGASGMPGVSSTKLPTTVPKVNSKWDGIPQSAKEKEHKKSGSRQSLTMFNRGISTSSSSESFEKRSSRRSESRGLQSRGTLSEASFHSAHSARSGNKLADLYGWEVRDFSAGDSSTNVSMEKSRPSTSRSISDRSSLPPGLRVATEATGPPKIPTTYFELSPPSAPNSLTPPAHSHSPSATPRNSSPATPDGPAPLVNVASTESEKTLCEPQEGPRDHIRTTTVEVPALVDEVIIRSSGPNVLGPSIARRKQILSSRPHQVQTSAVNQPLNSILKKENAFPRNDVVVQPNGAHVPHSNAESSSETLHHGSTVRGWLGLNSHHHSPHPSESPDSAIEDRNDLIITPTPESGGHSLRRRSRMSFFKHNH